MFFWSVFILNTASLGYQGYRFVARNYTLLYLLHIAYPTFRQKLNIICKSILNRYMDFPNVKHYTPIFEKKSTCIVTKTDTNTYEASFMIGKSAVKVMMEKVEPEIIEVKNSDSNSSLITSLIREAKPFITYKPIQWGNDKNVYYFRNGTSSNTY